ncbi:MAG TPA: hypothetical protein VGS20_15450 [Candidatus Acidoferrales bacterium]|nr:hypothetical protein [Candidatus Acidoferrales bacterium]
MIPGMNLRISLGKARQQAARRALQINVEKRVHAVGGDGQPAAALLAALPPVIGAPRIHPAPMLRAE